MDNVQNCGSYIKWNGNIKLHEYEILFFNIIDKCKKEYILIIQ
jgi:hypothetical protein